MPSAVDLFKQGRSEDLWQMCCGFIRLNISQFMEVQERLLLQQLEILNRCALGDKIMRGAKPGTMADFRRQVPLTTYKDYCPELLERREDILPEKPLLWAHSAGTSGEYPCKWVPMSSNYARELSEALYGVGMLSGCNGWGDISQIPKKINIIYSVAPRPYISGTFADLLRLQSPFNYLPPLEEAEGLSFEARTRLGFQQAMSQGFDYFFGLSLVLVSVGDRIRESAGNLNLRPFLKSPRALWRLTRGKLRSRMAGRSLLPRDLWSVKGIIGSGVDSAIYKQKIRNLWGRTPLDMYSCTEGSVIATQAWDYDGMTFLPNLNFLEFIPEEESLKWQMDRSYKPQTLLLDEVKAGENYEIVITNFHGGAMIRYRMGDMIRIQSLSDDKTGINLPQMTFERRVDDILDFVFVRLTEKMIWQAIESAGIPYVDWVASKKPGEPLLQVYIELADGRQASEADVAESIYQRITRLDDNDDTALAMRNDFANFVEFKVGVTLLPKGTFAGYRAYREAEGADLAHLKPPHVNPSPAVLDILTAEAEETIIVTKAGVQVQEKTGTEKAAVS